MTQIEALLAVVDAYNSACGVGDTTASWRLFGDSKKVAALRAGRDIQVKRLEAALAWLSANWPDGGAWPEEVARPATVNGENEAWGAR